MSLEHLPTTRDDGSVCLGAMLLKLTSARGSEGWLENQALALRLLSSLLNTKRTDGRTSTPWCECLGECDLGYSPLWGEHGLTSTVTPDSNDLEMLQTSLRTPPST